METEDLPKGWCNVAYSELCNTRSGNGKLIKGKLIDAHADGLFPAYSASGQDVWRDTWDHDGSAIIVSAVGARCGKTFVAKGKWSAIANTHIVWPNENILDLKFIQYKINNEKYWEKGGSAQPFVKVADSFSRLEALPPLPEQRRIVAKLDALQSRTRLAREALAAIPTLLDHYRQSILAAAFRGKLTRSDDFDDLESNGPAQSLESLTIPRSWTWSSASQACQRVVDCHNKTAPYVESGIQLIRTTNIRNGRIDLAKTKYVTEETYRFWSKRCPPQAGDIIYTREAPMGEVGMIPPGVKICMGQRMMLLRADNEKTLDGEYLLYWLQSPFLLGYITDKAVGGGVEHLRVGDVEALPVPLPSIDEQRLIASKLKPMLARIDDIRSVVANLVTVLSHVDQSLLATAFHGELVPQDPNDEPASVLLDRIRAARSQVGDAPRTRRKTSPGMDLMKATRTSTNQLKSSASDPYATLLTDLRAKGSLTSADAQAATGLDAADIRPLLQQLVAEGAATIKGQKRGTRYTVNKGGKR